MHVNIELFVLLKCQNFNFKLQSQESPHSSWSLFGPKGWKSILTLILAAWLQV
jgi:hypothetical protein